MIDPVEEVVVALGARPFGALRNRLASGVRSALGASLDELGEYAGPPGDPGLFGPASMVWRVHADLPAMLVGGISALMLQTLHPLAMAGVAAHSRFREDPYGRLRRTARFIAGTTFGGEAFARSLIEEVQAVHQRVQGLSPDGRSYSASDPALLTFVHTAEVWSFLRSFQRYARRPLLGAERDQYLDEVAEIAERLGAKEVPRSVHAVRSYLRDLEPELRRTSQAAEAIDFLRRPTSRVPLEVVGHEILTAGAIDLLPGFARRMLGLSGARDLAFAGVRAAVWSLAETIRWSVGPSAVAAISRGRIALGDPMTSSALSTMECQPRQPPGRGAE